MMDQLSEKIVNWVHLIDKRIIIGISGHGAAGKTTFANKLVNLLNINEVNNMNTDSYIVSSNVRKHTLIDYTYQNKNHRYKMTACHPSAHDLSTLERDVQMVRDGLSLYTIDTHYTTSKFISSKNKVTIVEGMSTGIY